MSTDILQSEFVSVQSALEASLGAQAVTAWAKDEANQGGISDAYPQMKHVSRNVISAQMMKEKGAVVGLSAAPKITMDLSRYVIERYATSMYRSKTKFPGGTGFGRFAKADQPTPTLTAATATGYTVVEGGAVPAGTLLWVEGFATAANNGLKVALTLSTATEIKVAGLVAEAAPPTTAVVYIVGYQGAAADIAVDASQNLTSAANVFLTLGIQPGSFGWLGGGTAAAPGLLGFTVAPQNRGHFRFKAVTAGAIAVDRRTQAWAPDVGAGKTIQIFFGMWWRNVPGTHPDYLEPSRTIELSYPGIGAGDATAFVYALGACVSTAAIKAGSEDKIVLELSFVARSMTAPTLVRATGANTPIVLSGTGAFTTADQVRRIRLMNGLDEAGISTDVLDWTLTIDNHVSPQVQQGTLGAKRMIFGDHDENLDLTAFCVDTAPWDAVRANTTCAYDVALRSTDCTLLFDVPSMDAMGAAPNIAENQAVTLPLQGEAHRDSTFSFVGGLTMFPFLPPD